MITNHSAAAILSVGSLVIQLEILIKEICYLRWLREVELENIEIKILEILSSTGGNNMLCA